MFPLLTSDQMRALDQHAIAELKIPGLILMENAALAVLAAIEERFDDVQDMAVAVVCGPGNNGGDGYALARQLHLRGAGVDLYSVLDPKQLTGDAKTNYQITKALDIPLIRLDKQTDGVDFSDYDLIVDAIFGTGAVRAPESVIKETIASINDSGVSVYSIDLPSGVDASTGATPGIAVDATVTVALQHAKLGHFFPPGRDLCGDIIVAPISIPPQSSKQDDNTAAFIVHRSSFQVPTDEDIATRLPPRPRAAHKGDFGKLLVVAGSRGMSGAARLVATAALRSGIGLVRVACPESIRAEVAAIPELVTIGLPETQSGAIAESAIEVLKNYLDWPDVIAVGPGLKTEEETALFLKDLFNIFRAAKFVIDADALNLIAIAELEKYLPAQAILTPHPGEFQRLAAASSFIVHRSSFHSTISALAEYAEKLQRTVLLKGAPTVTCSGGTLIVNPTGNPGLATGGTGDVLTGIISALWAQGLAQADAAWVGSYLHGRSADIAVESLGEISLVATDVIRHLPAAFKSVLPTTDHHHHNE